MCAVLLTFNCPQNHTLHWIIQSFVSSASQIPPKLTKNECEIKKKQNHQKSTLERDHNIKCDERLFGAQALYMYAKLICAL